MLERQVVSIPFSGGLDTKTDSKAVLAGRLTTLENGIFTKLNKIEKRTGYNKFSKTTYNGANTGTYSTAQGLTPFRDELLLFADQNVYSLNEQNGSWTTKGHAQSLSNKVYGVKTNGPYDMFAKNDQIGMISGWDGLSTVNYLVIDNNTQSTIVASSVSGTRPSQVISCGEYIFMFVQDSSTLNIYRVSKNSPNIVNSSLSVFTNLNATNSYMTVNVNGSNMVLSYKDTSNNFKLVYIKQTFEIGSPTNGLPSAITVTTTYTASSHYVHSSGDIYCFYSDGAGPDLKFKVYDSSFLSVSGPTTIKASVGSAAQSFHAVYASSTEVYVYWLTNAGGSSLDHIERATVKRDGTITTAWALKWINCKIIGNPAYWSNQHYMLLSFNSSVQPTIFMVDGSDNISSTFLIGKAAPKTDLAWPLALDGDVLYFTSREIAEFAPESGGSNQYRTDVITCNFNPTENFYTKELGQVLHISGGIPQIYDGVGVYENGFLHYPEYELTDVSGFGIATGSYNISVVWEWLDNKGNIHRSSPGSGKTISISTGSRSIQIKIKNLHFTEHGGSAVIYATTANGTIPYRIRTEATSSTTDYITYTLTSDVTNFTSNEILYTTGGVLDNAAIPSARIVEIYKDRLVLSGLEDPLQIWISKAVTPGVSISFNETIVRNLSPLGGDIKSMKFMDEKLLIFKDSLIFSMTGDGPNDLGQQDSITQPELISSDVGCPYPNSVVLTPEGVMFKSYKGIYLIDRTLRVSYIGAEVEDYNNLTIMSADLIQDKNQIRFIHQDGVCLVYDYYWKKWSTFTNHLANDAHIWKGLYVYLRVDDSSVYYQNDSFYKDDNIGYSLKIGTAWLKANGLQGFQRARRAAVLGEFKSPHILRMKVYYDYQSFNTDQVLFNAGGIISTETYGDDSPYGEVTEYGGDDGVYQFRAHLSKQKCEAIKFEFDDITSGDQGQGYSLTDLSLEVGIKRGLMKLRSGKSL